MQRGFSLVELSIVLVILGLLTGGILAGQSLIRASELRAATSEYNRYVTATQSFRDKYFALPGDMTNATKFWGQSAHCPGAYNQGTTDGTTCDGNGDGRIYYVGTYSAPTANEVFRFWQQLGNAGLIEGQYHGVTAASSGYYIEAGPNNSPASKLGNGRWTVSYGNNLVGTFSASMFLREFQPFMFIVGAPVSGSFNNGRILTAEEAWNIDTKLDDGRPGRGAVFVGWPLCTNAADGSQLDADYALMVAGKNCWIQFMPN